MKLQQNSKLVFIGDSIMDCGRGYPQGEGLYGYGNSFISLIDGMLKAFRPADNIRCVNMGIGGDTVKNLAMRWQKDVLDLAPDYVAVMIGVNDLWRQYDFPMVTDRHVMLPEYTAIYEKLICDTLPSVKGMILMTPFFMEPNKNDPFAIDLQRYQDAVKNLAVRYQTGFIDVQSCFDRYMQTVHPMTIGAYGDRIHPNLNGHFIIAKAFLDYIEAGIFQ